MNPTHSLKPRPYLLKNKIQPYAWGSRGESAFIPRLLGIDAKPDTPYAELWMGTHPNAPSEVVLDDGPVSLRQLISQYPREILGEAVCERFSGTLPFLFKVLSAGEALSIQAHPNKEQAQALHARDSKHYPDANHKPEIAVALDALTALLGFKRFPEILETLAEYPEIAGFVGQEVVNQLKHAGAPSPLEQRDLIRLMYAALIKRSVADQQGLDQAIDRLGERLSVSGSPLKEEEQLFLTLRRKYPGADVGLFTIFLLNLVHLSKGQGVFIPAGIPHAYLKGNIIECMANSDNVVRAGLTPKFKDVETLVDILTFEADPVPILGGASDQEEIVYQTPAPEFQIGRWKIKSGAEKSLQVDDSPKILLITAGEILLRWNAGSEDMVLRCGQSVLIPAFLKKFVMASPSTAELFQVQVPSR